MKIGMSRVFIILIIFILVSCSVETPEEEKVNTGSSEGSAASPLELTIDSAYSGTVADMGNSYYKFTSSSAGNYSIKVESLSITAGNSLQSYLYSDSGFSSGIEYQSCEADCTWDLGYRNLDSSTVFYLKVFAYDPATYKLTISKGKSEGSKDNPVELTVGTGYSGNIEGESYANGNSYYKFTTSTAGDYTLTMVNASSLNATLYSDSAFSAYSEYCTAGNNLSCTFNGTYSVPSLAANTVYYLKIYLPSTVSTYTSASYTLTVSAP